ncbi:hypothetical protein CSKR_110492 [Clonorchis sinensis]|uniref:Uncharacterized protein n=1 Tax=Clonorchis sinensis TaxID=79923 RepID=A0A3R7BZY3_CLOSI|nr:hypothetical protein CSKR_110492 [Clonorchis sinensis]
MKCLKEGGEARILLSHHLSRGCVSWWLIRWQLICSPSLATDLQTFRPQARRHRQCAVEWVLHPCLTAFIWFLKSI